MWLTIGKIALVVFVVLAIAFFVVAFVRNARRKGLPSWESSSHFDQIEGAMPPMPRLDVLGHEASDDGPPRRH